MSVEDTLKEFGYAITTEEYRTTGNGNIMIGKLVLKSDSDQIGKMLAIGNSYNKQRRVSIASGAVVFACLNGMFAGDFVSQRRHMGKVEEDLNTIILNAVTALEDNYQSLVSDSERMSEIYLTRREVGEIVGDMYMNHQIITATQLGIVKKQIQFSENFRMIEPSEMNLWNLYNNVTESLKTSHPVNYIRSHKNLHSFMMSRVRPETEPVYEEFEEMEELIDA